MPDIDSHKAELLQSLLIAMDSVSMATKVIYQHLLLQRTFVPIMNLNYFHAVELLHNSFVVMVTVVTIATRSAVTYFVPRNTCTLYGLKILT